MDGLGRRHGKERLRLRCSLEVPGAPESRWKEPIEAIGRGSREVGSARIVVASDEGANSAAGRMRLVMDRESGRASLGRSFVAASWVLSSPYFGGASWVRTAQVGAVGQ